VIDAPIQITDHKSTIKNAMSDLIALDVAVLPPADVSAKAIALSAALPDAESPPLRLDADHLPHITLMQLFARVNELDLVLSKVDETLRGVPPLSLAVTGGGQGTNSVSMTIEKAPPLVQLHERLMEALRGVERPDGGTGAFFGDDARLRDVLWVTGYRLKSSFHHFEPHITLGHGAEPPLIEPFTFEADTVAVCHLGRYCTCRRVLRQWMLTP
jgi:2'-5' RNA ligase superfamily